MSLAQGNNTPTRPRIEPGSPDPESDALTTRPVRPYFTHVGYIILYNNILRHRTKFKILDYMATCGKEERINKREKIETGRERGQFNKGK